MNTQAPFDVKVTVGTIRSQRAGDVVLVYLEDGNSDRLVLRYDQLSAKYRNIVRTLADDPLGILQRADHGIGNA